MTNGKKASCHLSATEINHKDRRNAADKRRKRDAEDTQAASVRVCSGTNERGAETEYLDEAWLTAPVSPMLSETRLLLPATLHSPLRSTTNKRTLGDLHDGTPLIALPLLRFYFFSFISLSPRALVKCADCVDQPTLCPAAFPFWRSCNNNVLSSGLPLPAPWLSGALLLSAGRPEKRGAGPVLLRFRV